MKFISTELEGVFILEPRIFSDSRGYFFESFSQREFNEAIKPVHFVQQNESASSKGVVRGLHFQAPPYSQAKLVRCVAGAVKDVALDIRKGSPTFGKHIEVVLSDENHLQLFIPKGFAHGFEVLSDRAVFQYMCDEYYHPESEMGINLFDEDLSIGWTTKKEDAILSNKDILFPAFNMIESPFKFGENC